jgi:hypothetical protein
MVCPAARRDLCEPGGGDTGIIPAKIKFILHAELEGTVTTPSFLFSR